MNLHGCPDTQPTLEAAEVVIDDVTLDHTDQFLPAGEASAVVPFPLEDPPEALHGAVVDAFSHSGHALRNAGCGQLVVEDLRRCPGRCGAGGGRLGRLPAPGPECYGPARHRWYPG